MKSIDFSKKEIQIITVVNLLIFLAYYSYGLSFLMDNSGGMDIVFTAILIFGAVVHLFLNLIAFGVAQQKFAEKKDSFKAGILIAFLLTVFGVIAYPFSLMIMKGIYGT